MFFSLIESCIRNVSGKTGILLRRAYYSGRLGKCGKKLIISEGVYFDHPRSIELGDYVWIDRNAILIAGRLSDHDQMKMPSNYDDSITGRIVVGSFSHVGIGTVLQGHGGIIIGENFTSSAYSKIYSVSNDPKQTFEGTLRESTGKTPAAFLNQIIIEKNVWLGLNVSVLGGKIGRDTFVKANSVITSDIPDNSIVEGSTGVRIQERFSERKG
jgi:acetyltransferase-like isoleucine patch superfamily enzyme